MKKTKKIIIAAMAVLLLTGCTKTLMDGDKKRIINDQTGQSLTSNILCLPTEEHFNGWYLDKEFKNKVDLDTYKVTSDVTLYGKWSEKKESNVEVKEDVKKEEVVNTTKKVDKKKKITTTTTTTIAIDKYYVVTFETNGHDKIDSQKVKHDDIIVAPTVSKTLYEKYEENEKYMDVKLKDLNKCTAMGVYEKANYNGLWVQLFVRPLAWLIIQLGNLINDYGLSVMLIGLFIRLLILPFSAKTINQQENMKKAQPELARLEEKYKDSKDQAAMMMKSQETMAIYKKYNINPMSSCLVALIQLPLFFAFLEAINRVPAIFENSTWVFQLGTTPMYGIQNGEYQYIALILLIVGFTALSFKFSMTSMGGNSQQAKQSKFMLIFMTVFIGIASVQLPSAIALYWVVTNAFSVIQTLIMKRKQSK